MASNRKYWADREAEALKHYITDEAEYDREIRRIYQNMLDNCQKEIDSFYGKYAAAEGISIADAKKRVSKADIAAFERKAKQYVKDKDFSPKANEEMRLYNTMMKVNRLEMLKANLGLETIAGHEELAKFMEGILKGRTEDELKRQAGILGKTVRNPAEKAHALVNGSFHNGTFSDRIWQYQDLMREELGKLLQQGLIQGKGARAIAKDLKKYWFGNDPRTGGGATYCMERLMRTELARVQTEAQKQSFIRNGFTMYTFHCNEHPSRYGTCSRCRRLNGKHFKVEDMMPGDNAPPLHPHCRCSTSAYEDNEEYEAWLDYLESGGTTDEWNQMKKSVATESETVDEIQFVPAKTVEEAEAYAQRFVSTYKSKYSGNVSYKGMSVEQANKVNKALTAIYSKYDCERLDNITVMNFREAKWKNAVEDGVAAAYQWGGNGGTLYINQKLIGTAKLEAAFNKKGKGLLDTVLGGIDKMLERPDLKPLQRKYLEALKKSRVQCQAQRMDDFTEAVIVHELGHSLDDKLFRKQFKSLRNKDGFDIAESMERYGPGVSGYAVSKGEEYIAESFASWYYGQTENLDPGLVEIFENSRRKKQNNSEKVLEIPKKSAKIKVDYVTVNIQKVLQEAKDGIRHGGVYKEAMNKRQHRLEKTIRSRTDTIREHEDKIANPQKYHPDWDSWPQAKRDWTLKKWHEDIERNSEQVAIDKAVYLERFGYEYEY